MYSHLLSLWGIMISITKYVFDRYDNWLIWCRVPVNKYYVIKYYNTWVSDGIFVKSAYKQPYKHIEISLWMQSW